MPNPLSTIARRTAGRSLPWARMYMAGRFVLVKGRAAYTGLTESERSQLAELLRKSRGRPSNLSKREREDLGKLVRKAAAAARQG